MSNYPASFLERENLSRAWRWILSGSNPVYKNLFRAQYDAWGLNINENLNLLHRELSTEGGYGPDSATKIYYPKPDGTLRTYTLLTVRDQIVYQALVNYLAECFSPSLYPLYHKVVFSNLYAGKTSFTFYRKWKASFCEFNSTMRSLYNAKYFYIADYDCVSFYDSIDYSVLERLLSTKIRNRKFTDLLLKCLSTWNKAEEGPLLKQGIPQGPIASGFIGEIILLSLDKKFGQQKQVRYLRYADDIKLLSKSEDAIKRVKVTLERDARRIGLLPQIEKIKVRKIENINTEIKMAPSEILMSLSPSVRKTSKAYNRLLKESLQEEVIIDETLFKYTLPLLSPSEKTLRLFLRIYSKYPHLAYSFCCYFEKFGQNQRIKEKMITYLIKQPIYETEFAEYLTFLAQSYIPVALRRLTNYCFKQLRRRKTWDPLYHLSLFKVAWLAKQYRPYLIKHFEKRTDGWLKTMMIDVLWKDILTSTRLATNIVQEAVESSDIDFSLVGTYNAFYDGINIRSKMSAINRYAQETLICLGLRRYRGYKLCPIRSHLSKIFGCQFMPDFHAVFGRGYRHASKQCALASSYYYTDPTAFINAIDVFNDTATKRLFKKDIRLVYPKIKHGQKEADYGRFFENSTKFYQYYPNTFVGFRACHEARGTTILSHPKVFRTGAYTTEVSYQKKNSIVKKLARAYQEWIKAW